MEEWLIKWFIWYNHTIFATVSIELPLQFDFELLIALSVPDAKLVRNCFKTAASSLDTTKDWDITDPQSTHHALVSSPD